MQWLMPVIPAHREAKGRGWFEVRREVGEKERKEGRKNLARAKLGKIV